MLKENNIYKWEFTLDDKDLDKLCKLSGDNNPIHSDDSHAKSLGFETTISNILICQKI